MLKQANLSFSVAAQSYGDDVTSIQFSTQDKNTAKLIFSIKEGKLPLDLTDVEAKVDLVMGDKSVFDDNIATVTAPLDGKLEYMITSEQIRHPGRARGELQLTSKDGQSIGGFRFNFTVKKALVDEMAGPVKEYYVQDLEAIKAEIQKTADSIKDLDVVRIDTKLNELEEQIGEGVGVDEQARQQIEEVTTQLADTAKKNDVILKSEGVGLNNVKPDLLAAIEGGEGTTFNLLSIPRPGSVTPKETNFIRESSNMYNQAADTKGYIVGDTGTLNTSENYAVSDYILVSPNTTYFVYGVPSIAEYSENKTFLRRRYTSTDGSPEGRQFKVSNDCYYVRLNLLYKITNYATARMNLGTADLGYEPYENLLKPEIKITGGSLSAESVKAENLVSKSATSSKRTPLGELAFYLYSNSTVPPNIDTEKKTITLKGKFWLYNRKKRYEFADDVVINYLTTASNQYLLYNTETNTFRVVASSNETVIAEDELLVMVMGIGSNATKIRTVNFMSDYTINGLSPNGANNKPYYFAPEELVGSYVANQGTYNQLNTVSSLYSAYQTLANEHRDYLTMQNVGKDTSNAYDIYRCSLTPKQVPATSLNKKIPKLVFITGLHGGEKGSVYSVYHFVRKLCKEWQTDPLLEYLRFNVQFVFIPLANPWAFVDANRTEATFYGRTNVNLVDLNRNFSYNWSAGTPGTSTYGGTKAFSEKESQYVKAMLDEHSDALWFGDYHTNGTSGEEWGNLMWQSLTSGSQLSEDLSITAKYTIEKLTRDFTKNYNLSPNTDFMGFIGYTSEGGMAKEYGASLGIPSQTFESWRKFPSESVDYSNDTLKATLEYLTNMFINVIRHYKNKK